MLASDQPRMLGQQCYLMLNNQKVRDVIDTITSKVVLILWRFTDERKAPRRASWGATQA
jgi:hypothetical protein